MQLIFSFLTLGLIIFWAWFMIKIVFYSLAEIFREVFPPREQHTHYTNQYNVYPPDPEKEQELKAEMEFERSMRGLGRR